jgi:hypothetical protein
VTSPKKAETEEETKSKTIVVKTRNSHPVSEVNKNAKATVKN